MKTKWLDRRIACPGPHLCLCLSELEFLRVCKALRVDNAGAWISNDHSNATVHYIVSGTGQKHCVVCLRGFEGRDPIEVAGLLVHEAVHIWQEYASDIGERQPGVEQEAYAIQSIAQELMAEFSRRQLSITPTR